jgi:uncharacterized iron-regulated membrane protein
VFRKVIFWSHLSCGVVAGLVILMMSATGVLLTYERQLLAWAERDLYVEPAPAGAERLGIQALLAGLVAREPAFAATSITLKPDPGAPVQVAAGRSDVRNLNPYTGEVIATADSRLHAFFDAVTAWHRWFNVGEEDRDAARAITGAANLVFLFLLLSGLYLWLPPIFNRIAFRARLLFNPQARTGKARDFNWHHVFGIWSAIPLAIVVASATVFSYDWANNLVYRSFGEEPPVRRPEASAPGPQFRAMAGMLSLDELAARAAAAVPGWNRLTVTLPAAASREVVFALDRGTGGQPQHRHEIVLDAASGAVIASRPFASETPGRQARSILRFLHTGEVFGIAGQTVAGIVSLTSTVMVWTGLALACRRLILPLLRRRSGERTAAKGVTESA